MDRGVWWAIVRRVLRLRQDSVTKPPPTDVINAR